MADGVPSPKVSIVMPVYNGGRYFELALQSALAQTYANFEIVIVNDGSRDAGETDEIGRRYASAHPEKVRYFHQENSGAGGALNHGVRVMTGDIFCWLSHDDLYVPEKTQVQVDFWLGLNRPDAMLCSNYTLIDPEGVQFADVRFNHAQFSSAPRIPLYRGAVNGCTVFIPAEVMRSVEGPFDPSLRHTQDFTLWKQLLEKHEFFHVPRSLVAYRVHPSQDSQRPDMVAEGEVLWRGMIDDLSPTGRAQLYGSSWRFYDETYKVLADSPYKDTAAYLVERRDACIAETLVSVVIPFFNEVGLVVRALASVRAQTHGRLDIILVDDGSTEPLDELLIQIAGEPRARLLSQANAGPGAARNHGLRHARGEYVAFLDADDTFLPTKIACQLERMAKAGALVSHTSYLVTHVDTEAMDLADSGASSQVVYPTILASCPIATPTVMLHRRVLAQGFAFPPAHIAEDTAAWVDLAARHPILGIREPLTVVEREEATASTSLEKGVRGLQFLLNRFAADPVHSRQAGPLKELEAGLAHLRSLAARGERRHAGPTMNPEGRAAAHGLLLAQAEGAMAIGRPDAAETLLLTANRLTETADAWSVLALAYRMTSRHEQALESANRAVALAPAASVPASILHVRALALAQFGRMREAAADLARAQQAQPDAPAIAYALASVLASLGEFEGADALFAHDTPVPLDNGAFTSTGVVSFAPPRRGALAGLNWTLARRVKLDESRLAGAMAEVELVHFICCDSRYLKLFAGPVLRSLEQNADLRVGLHLHVINPDAEAAQVLADLQSSSSAVPVSASSEEVSLPRWEETQRRTYYSCARFLLLPSLLELYGKPVLVTDADQLVVRSLRPLMDGTADSDAGLLVSPSSPFNLLSLVSASVVIARPTKAGHAFFKAVEEYLAQALANPRRVKWHLDQAALAVAYLKNKTADIALIAPGTMLSELYRDDEVDLGEAVFWSVTYSIPENARKMSSRLFQEYGDKPSGAAGPAATNQAAGRARPAHPARGALQ